MVNLKRIAGPNLVASQYKGSVIKISLQVFVLLFVIFFPIVCLALHGNSDLAPHYVISGSTKDCIY